MLTTLLSAKKPSAELKKMGHGPLIEVMGGKVILSLHEAWVQG